MLAEEALQSVRQTAQTLAMTESRVRRLSAYLEEQGVVFPRNARHGRLYSVTVQQQIKQIGQLMDIDRLPMKAAVRMVLPAAVSGDDPASTSLQVAALSATVQSQHAEITQLRELVNTVVQQNTRILAMLHEADPHLADQSDSDDKRDVTTPMPSITQTDSAPTTVAAADVDTATRESPTQSYLNHKMDDVAVEHNATPKTLAQMQLPAEDHRKPKWWEKWRS
ncbi:MAG: hypothetical protein LKI92_06275 [Schleiferilactobacillus harbinensis]|jgi:hypothetical protein|nr:hypothetical protein [Schleiferilactobacillus harbinensis]MCI1912077.1 hypothetical protein [Schleiferilactobacillus harbinensis]